jgi:serine/threonine protein phosphatase 1
MIFRARPTPAPLPVLAAPVAVVGDIHGRDDLLAQMLERLAARGDASALRVIFVGDMVDRGPASAAVLTRLAALQAQPAPFAGVTCLMGNHDRMMLDFLASPAKAGPRWLSHGGAETMASFGIATDRPGGGDVEARFAALAAALRGALGPVEGFLADLPVRWSEGTFWVTHAGANPRKDPATQSDAACLWGEDRFYKGARRDGLWVAHGHRIVPEPFAQGGRIAVDTGAWRTGRLTAAVLTQGALTFEST